MFQSPDVATRAGWPCPTNACATAEARLAVWNDATASSYDDAVWAKAGAVSAAGATDAAGETRPVVLPAVRPAGAGAVAGGETAAGCGVRLAAGDCDVAGRGLGRSADAMALHGAFAAISTATARTAA